MVLIRAARAAISALISASICFAAVEAQDHAAASGQKQTIGGAAAGEMTNRPRTSKVAK